MRAWLAVVAIVISAGCSSEEAARSTPAPAASAPPAQAAPAPAPQAVPALPAPPPAAGFENAGPARAWMGPLPPMPFLNYPGGRPPETIRAVYEYAARRPEVLHYVPCFCGCERSGHRNNDDCFVSGRESDGRPIWEPHGAT